MCKCDVFSVIIFFIQARETPVPPPIDENLRKKQELERRKSIEISIGQNLVSTGNCKTKSPV